jgi:hypothetical protein
MPTRPSAPTASTIVAARKIWAMICAMAEGERLLPSPIAMGDKRSAEGGLRGVRAFRRTLTWPYEPGITATYLPHSVL